MDFMDMMPIHDDCADVHAWRAPPKAAREVAAE